MTVMRAVGDSAFLLVVVAAAAALAVGSGSRQRVGDIVERFPLGTIGCMVADNLCRADETCTDDHLFGVCLSVGTQTKDVNYNFNKLLLEKLEREIWMLIFAGYSWQDAYTQCTLQNLLVTHQQQAPFDRITCLHLSASWPLGDHSSSPQELLIKGRLPKSEDSFSIDTSKLYNLPNSRKRDEFVNIHKYFDKPAVPSRRNGGIASDMMPPMETYLNSGYQEEKRSDQQPQLSAGINHEDLKEMKKYLMMLEDFMDAEDAEDRALGSDSSLPKGESKEVAYNDRFQSSPLSDKTGQGGAGDNPPDFDVLASSDKGLEASLQQPDGMNSENEENMPDLTPYELQLLEKLQEVPPTGKSALSQKEQDDFKYSEKLDDGGISNETEEKSTVDSLLQDLSDTSREKDTSNNKGKSSYEEVATDYAFVVLSKSLENPDKGTEFVRELEKMIKLPLRTLTDVEVQNQQITFRINPNPALMNASEIANQAEAHKSQLEAATGLQLISAGIGNEIKVVESRNKPPKYFVLTFVLCGCIAGVLLAVVVIYLIKRHSHSKQKLSQLATTASEPSEACKDYQDLCRQRMQSKSSEKPEPLHAASRIGSVSEAQVRSPSSRSSTSSWSEEPVSSNMDISTGHIVLSYMEDHLKNKDRLDQEWEALCAYEADPSGTTIALDSSNARKNRYSDILPYDHSRVILNETANASTSDYVNANTITDHDPRNPAYIATQGPLPHTVADFWQMVWEQGSVVIVMLTKLTENGEAMCHRYWPEEGSDLYHIYEVHLVSEHIWCDDYLVRSFYLKNLQTNETRTVTQFHFLSWMDLDVPSSIKALLDFRRKVNKSYRGRSCPIVVHCSDGCGRTGTYCLTDMVLNRMAKGAKEIDIAATLEHIRDQRMTMVKTKEQFQYALAAVAEEVNAILKALPQ